MYDQEKIKKMKNHELAMEAYFYAYNHKLFGGASQKKAVKCYEQIILVLDQDEYVLIHLCTNELELYYFAHPTLIHNIYVHYFFFLFVDNIIL